MKFTTKLLTLLLVLMLLVQSSLVSIFAVVPSIDVDTSVLEAAPRYDEASDVQYKTSGKYIYNWGIREEDATFLTIYAEDFYEDANVDFDDLAALAGGTQSTASSSALYKKLQSIMKSAHDYETSYNATRDLYQYTDCTGDNYNKISSFYSGKSIGPSWDSGSTWNREHTWPNSKGLGGNDENDIMMLRPTSVSENSSRGNTAYGKSSGYYNPNSESGGKYDLRGDVARICLYVYVRWGNTSKMWGSGGVMENLNVLLLWMEEDPVDTWEMGRNDSVQAITGTRNVFVDYPELAWLLFSEEVPDDMVTPSGEASNGVLGGGNGGSTGGNTGSDDNTGSGNTGSGNTGNDDNTGSGNTGNDDNTGSGNTGSGNTGSGSTTPSTSSKIELTVNSLGLTSQSYTSATATVGGVGFEWIQLGNYGDGIQVRDKDGKTSSFWNTTAFSSPISKIELVYSSSKDITYSNPDCEIFSFGNGVNNYTSTVKLSTTSGVKTYTITPDAETYTYFRFEHDLGYSMYWESITIYLADGTTVDPGQGGNQGGNTGNDNPGGNQGGNSGSTTPSTSSKVELTVNSLGLTSQSYTSATATVGGVGFEWIQLGNYGDGIQVRDKDGKTSSLWNTTPFSSPIARIELVYSSTKDVTHSNPDCAIYSFGNGVDNYTCTVKLSTESGVTTYTITPDAETYTYFRFEHDLGYTQYWESITIVLADGTTVNPGQGGNQGGNTGNENITGNELNDFMDAVKAMTNLKGEDLYNKICVALNAYSKLTADEKASVSTEYATLKGIIESYNNSANAANSDANEVGKKLFGAFVFTVSTLSLAGFGFFGKKYF